MVRLFGVWCGDYDLFFLVLFHDYNIIVKLKSKFEFWISNQNLCLENRNRILYSINELHNRNRKTSRKIQIQNFSSKIQI